MKKKVWFGTFQSKNLTCFPYGVFTLQYRTLKDLKEAKKNMISCKLINKFSLEVEVGLKEV